MRTKWRIIFNTDATDMDAITDAMEIVFEKFESYYGENNFFDFIDDDYVADDNYIQIIPATNPEFFVRLEESMKLYREQTEQYRTKVIHSYKTAIGKPKIADEDIKLVDFLTKIDKCYGLSNYIKFVSNEYTLHSGMMWDVDYYDCPYPDEDIINEIKDNPENWYIGDVIFHY